MINTIPNITINGQSTIFGGYIYNVKYNIQYGENQSSVVISVVSENGSYQVSQTNLINTYCSPYTIQIGNNITFIGYLESINKHTSPGGNTLRLEFVDTSHVLDIIQVGLYKRHGLTSTPNLIIVGFELDPCNQENYAKPLSNFYDPCSPCLNNQLQQDVKNFVDCEEKAKFEIHDVKYNFNELLGKITIPIQNSISVNPDYLQQYTGTLREVLNQWCQDFGFFFYWNNGSIVFKDLRNTIQVNANLENFCPNVLEYDESYSMKNSVQTGTITNFSRPGDPAKIYECQSAIYIELQSLLQNASYSLPLTITPNIDKVAAGLCSYSQDLRDLYYFYVEYQMYSSSHFYKGKILEKLGMTILSGQITLGNQKGTTFLSISDAPTPPELDGLAPNISSIDPFLDSNSGLLNNKQLQNVTVIKNDDDFYNCVQLLDFETQWKVVTQPNNYFFFLAEHNETHHQKFVSEEKEFASFLNKYAVYVPSPNDPFFEDYDFQLDNLCGVNYFVNTGNVTYNFLGDSMGSLKLYNTSAQAAANGYGTIMGDLPFAKFLSIIHDAGDQSSSNSLSNGGGFLPFKLIVAERGRNSFVPESVTNSLGSTSVNDFYLLANATKLLPYKIGSKNNLRGEFIGSILDAGSSDTSSNIGDVSLFVGCYQSTDAFRITQINGYNNEASPGTLFDGKPLNKEQDPTLQGAQIVYQYPDLKCSIIGNHSFGSRTALHANVVVFKTPIGQFKYTEPTDAIFGTVIEKTKKTRRIINKIESFNSTNMSSSCSYNKFKLNYRNISDDSLKVLVKNNQICQFDPTQIQQIHQKFSNNLALNYSQPTVSKTFRIAGIDLNGYAPTISNGLLNVDISIDDKGVSSVYEFGTRLMILPAERSLNYSSANMLLYHGSYTNTVNYFPTVGQPNL